MKKFSDYLEKIVSEEKVSKEQLTKKIGELYDDLSLTFSGIKNLESDDFGSEVKKIKADFQSLIGDVSNLFYKKLKNK